MSATSACAPRRPKAFVTGASRGVGEWTVTALASHGWDLAIGCRCQVWRAVHVADRLRASGSAPIAVAGDLVDPDARSRVLTVVCSWAPRLDALILNAAGAIGCGTPPRPIAARGEDPHVALATGLARELSPGGCIVYVTSHWAHLYGNVSAFPREYEPVAASKHKSEHALIKLQRTLTAHGHDVRLIVVTAGVVTGTPVGAWALTQHAEFAAAQRAIGNVVTAEHLGKRIAAVTVDRSLPNGHLEVVGAPLAALARKHRDARRTATRGLRHS